MFFNDIVGLDVVDGPQNQVHIWSSNIEKIPQHRCCIRPIPLAKSKKNIPQKTKKAKKKYSVIVIPIPGVEPGSTRIIANESIESG